MSGIYIRGMVMPKTCAACFCSRENECGITHYEPTFEEWYEDGVRDCPLVPVPDHGRLVDADEAEKEGWFLAKYTGRMPYEYICKRWSDCQTIIPADKEGE